MADLRPLYKDIPELAAAENHFQARDLAYKLRDKKRLAEILTDFALDNYVQSIALYEETFHGESRRFEDMVEAAVKECQDAVASGSLRRMQQAARENIGFLSQAREAIAAHGEKYGVPVPHPRLTRIERLIRNEVRAAVERALEAGA